MPLNSKGGRKLVFVGNVKTNLVNKYTSGAGVGAVSTSARRSLKRLATSSAGTMDDTGNLIPGKPCCSVPPPLADFEVQPTSNFDETTGIITFDVKNIGSKDSTGYGNIMDVRSIFEVTTNIEEARQLRKVPASAPFRFIQDGVSYTYYQKSL